MKRFLFSLVLVGFIIASAQSQSKLFTMKEAVQGAYGSLKPESYEYAQWKFGNQAITYVKSYSTLWEHGLGSEEKQILSVSEINEALKAKGFELCDYFPLDYKWTDANSIRFSNLGNTYTYNLSQKMLVLLSKSDEKGENQDYHSSNSHTAYTIENNLYINNAGGAAKAITTDKDKGIVNGSNYVHRQEFGIDKGIFWSTKGNLLAFYRKDETMVTEYPIVNTGDRIAALKSIKYPMAGMTSENVTLGIYDIKTGKTIFLETGEPKEQYLTAISWDPTEKFVFIGVLNRGQNHLKMNQYDAITGKFVKTLFEEKSERWTEPEKPLTFLPNNPKQFIWQSERDGFNHLYLYDIDGKLQKQISKGNSPVTDILGFDATGDNIFYSVATDLALETQVFKTEIKSLKTIQSTQGKGKHNCILSSDGKYLFDHFSSLTVSAEESIIEVATAKKTVLFTAPNPLSNYKMPQVELVKITAADGKTVLNGRLIKPADFDPNKKYPVVIYVYGGPHAQMVHNQWLGGTGLWDYYMAQNGYVMFTLDNRGSANRGFEFESVIHRNLGVNEAQDQMKGVEYLKSLPYVDGTRMGVHGWSFGGFITTTLMTDYPDVFKAGVAGGPVIDWKFYEVMYGERYMDTPEENPEGYKNTSLLNKAGNLKGKLLMIHGAVDPVVVWQNSLEFMKECVKKDKQVDYFVYPDHEHNVRGKDRIHLMQKVTDYFNLYLKP